MNILQYKKINRDKLIDYMDSNKLRLRILLEAESDFGRTIYIEQDNQILGIATQYINELHPTFDNIDFAVDTANEKVFIALYENLLTNRTSSLPLSMCLSERDANVLRGFLENHHFSLIVKCEMPEIDIERSLTGLSEYRLPEGFRLEKYSGLNEEESKKLRQFRLNGYEKTHFWNPPLRMDHPYWLEKDLNSENQKISWVVFREKNIILCSDAHIDKDIVHIGWGWHDDQYEGHLELKHIWAIVLSQQLEFCKRSKKQFIGEFDSTDKYGQIKKSLLTHLKQENYYIYKQLSIN